jgi:AcrR family transcriptional regulator
MSDTRTDILDVAERLFASRGIDAVSIRDVVEAAGVNLASAHYHFGSRDELVREAIRRRVVPMNDRRVRDLDAVLAAAGDDPPDLEAVLRAFITPVFELADERPHIGWLLAHVDVTPDEKLRLFFYSLFTELVWRFAAALRRALPEMPDREGWTRVQFTFGAMIFTLAKRYDRELTAGGRIEPLSGVALVDQWVDFCAAGLRAPIRHTETQHAKQAAAETA